MYQKYLHSSSGEATGWKYNWKSGCEFNLLVRFNCTADPRDQSPNPPTLLCAARHQRKKHRTCLWKSQPDLLVELLSMVSGHYGLSPSSVLTSSVLRNMHGSLWITFWGHLCIPETGSGQMRGEDSEKDTCLLGASQITKDLKPLILWIFFFFPDWVVFYFIFFYL